jgi:hypothetical protein
MAQCHKLDIKDTTRILPNSTNTVELGLGDVFSPLSPLRSPLEVPFERASKIFGIKLGGSSKTRG